MHWKERLETANLPAGDFPILSGFIEKEITDKDPSPTTLYTMSDRLIILTNILHGCGAGDLTKAKTEHFTSAVARIRKQYPKPNTQRMHINMLKRFCKFLVDEKRVKLNCLRIQTVKLLSVNWRSKTDDDVLTPKELDKVIEEAETARDKAIITMMVDGCFRPIEIRTMRWDQLFFDEYGCRVKVAEETQYEREFRLTFSLPYLLRWRENYPDGKLEGRKPVFVNERRDRAGNYKVIGNDMMKHLVYRIRDKTGIKKLKPSIFRSTGLINDVERGMDHTYLCMKGWGNLSTNMIRTYVKPSREYMDRVALQRMGRPIPEGKKLYRTDRIQDMLKPKVCPNEKCQSLVPATVAFCPACGVPVTEEAKQKRQSLKEAIIQEVLKELQKEK
ncbi:MAG: tyrosine-type recombinase/integrase [Methanomicrobiales archaeon]|nr:tyrosine-type recombinase/integrase [Methanomicrobiales archaeon]